MFEREDDHLATESEAHAEWHRNTGLRYGCPQDACWEPDPEPVAVQCALESGHAPHDHNADCYCPGVTPYPNPYAYDRYAVGPEDPRDLPF